MKVLTVPQSGSLAGQTASRNRFGQYLRTRATPVNPNSPAQTDVRAGFADAASLWRTLASGVQDAWRYLALANPRTDSLGQSITLTGFQLFVGCTAGLATIGVSSPAACPTGAGIGAPTLAVGDASIAAPLALNFTPTPVPAAHTLVIYSSPPVSLGTLYNGDYRFLMTEAAAATSGALPLGALQAKWGTIIPGQRFFFRSRLYCISGTNKGWSSPDSNVTMLDTVA